MSQLKLRKSDVIVGRYIQNHFDGKREKCDHIKQFFMINKMNGCSDLISQVKLVTSPYFIMLFHWSHLFLLGEDDGKFGFSRYEVL